MKSQTPTAQEKHPVFLEDQRAFFDELISKEWESYLSPEWDNSRRFEVARIFRLIGSPPHRITDMGCGCGFHDLVMASQPGVEEVVGIDYSPMSIQRANAAYPHPKVTRQVGDVFSLPPGGADLVVSFQVIEHLQDADQFVRACSAQAAPGGFVAIATPNRHRLMNRLRRLVGRPEQLSDPQHYREYTLMDLRRMGEAAGLVLHGGFGHSMSLYIPGVRCNVLPQPVVLHAGNRLPGWADVVCAVFRKA